MTSGPASPDDAEQLRAQIEQTREHIGQTAEQLVAKADVKARAQAKVTDLTQRAKGLDGAGKYRVPVMVIAAGLLVTGAAILVRARSRR
jgi:septal ring factor EnvC (AmiA/AmiB activator)